MGTENTPPGTNLPKGWVPSVANAGLNITALAPKRNIFRGGKRFILYRGKHYPQD